MRTTMYSEHSAKSKAIRLLFSFLTIVMAPLPVCAQHLNAGALGTNQNSQLIFANGNEFVTSSGYVGKPMYTNAGTFGGYYQIGITPTALPVTVANGGPVSNAPALGSFIRMRIESVTGPAGGAFAFWESGSNAPTASVTVGDTTPSPLFPLSDRLTGAGAPGADPYGHIHGRRFTVNKAGNYTVGFKLLDTSTNGLTNGPIHSPSDTLQVNFSTVVALAMRRVQPTNGASAMLIFHQGGLTNVFVEATTNVSATNWSVIAGPFTNAPFGAVSTTTLLDTNAGPALRFYRLRGLAP